MTFHLMFHMTCVVALVTVNCKGTPSNPLTHMVQLNSYDLSLVNLDFRKIC
uniref:Uncharacterized protein n=1 Tax=Octopus bimaculoides TaxID=37653 RepID=A0A0L8FG21_OCTBM